MAVPQTRQRAILMASRVRPVTRPAATHDRAPVDGLFGTLEPWVTMADALGWPNEHRVGFPRLDDTGTSADGYRERDWRDGDEPLFTVTEKARSWVVNTGRDWKEGGTREDAQTIDAESNPAPAAVIGTSGAWWIQRPATTVCGDPRLGNPGHRDREGGEPQFQTEAIRLTIEDALVLQSFPRDFPVQGTKTRRFEQIGNAICPRLAHHILKGLVGKEDEQW